MIRWPTIGFVLGRLILALAAAMLAPLAWAAIRRDEALGPFLVSFGVTAASGALALWGLRRRRDDLSPREAIFLVVGAWIVTPLFGSLPFLLAPQFDGFTDAFFESVSGFTTTGATVLAEVESLAPPVQLWRCFSHWLGGMGIVLLVVAVLPLVGHGGMHLYRAEFSGARSERLKPRIAETAASLWRIYVALSLAEYVALRVAGLDVFEALCHTFSTMGTGGYSTRTASVGAFGSLAVELVIVVFMLLAGASFIQMYKLSGQRRLAAFFGDFEIRLYFGFVAIATALIALYMTTAAGYPAGRALRVSLFQVTSIITTTGFVTENFEVWPVLPQVVLLALMYVGGCTGSTAGGMKVARIAMLARVVDREFRRMVERRGVFSIRLGGGVVAEEAVQSLLSLVYLALLVNFVAVVVLAAAHVDVLTAISAVAACMFNVGPGLGAVGPAEHYGHLPAIAKWTLSFCMIAGRLEFYTLLVILTRAFWRR
jgi:trk system potassium uptake protein TrkH